MKWIIVLLALFSDGLGQYSTINILWPNLMQAAQSLAIQLPRTAGIGQHHVVTANRRNQIAQQPESSIQLKPRMRPGTICPFNDAGPMTVTKIVTRTVVVREMPSCPPIPTPEQDPPPPPPPPSSTLTRLGDKSTTASSWMPGQFFWTELKRD